MRSGCNYFSTFRHLLVSTFTLKQDYAKSNDKSREFREYGAQTHLWGSLSLWERCCETTERRGTRERGSPRFAHLRTACHSSRGKESGKQEINRASLIIIDLRRADRRENEQRGGRRFARDDRVPHFLPENLRGATNAPHQTDSSNLSFDRAPRSFPRFRR